MMIHITEACSMNCAHCMSDCKPSGKHMSVNTLKQVIHWLQLNTECQHTVISGGEPTEHPQFIEMMNTLFTEFDKTEQQKIVTITTNGFWCLDHIAEAKEIAKGSKTVKVFWQVSTDSRYYPKELPVHKKLWREEGFCLCTQCCDRIYPQGRALVNNIPWEAKASKCFNVRAIARQLKKPTISDIVEMLWDRHYTCTPSINILGGIKLGESLLCPQIATIYDDEETIIKAILECKCNRCSMITNQLPDVYKLIGGFM